MNDATPGDATEGSISCCLAQLKAGDPAAVKPLWDGYFARLVAFTRDRLRALPRAVADEEDVALSAFDSFCQAATAGRFPRLDDRHDLWQVLIVIASRKAVGVVRHESRDKRGGRDGRAPDPWDELVKAIAKDPPPEEIAEMAEGFDRLLGLLGNGDLRSVAIWKMEGYTNAEIGAKLGRSVPTVERKVAAIRQIWQREADR